MSKRRLTPRTRHRKKRIKPSKSSKSSKQSNITTVGKKILDTVPDILDNSSNDSFEAELNILQEKKILFKSSISTVYLSERYQIVSKEYSNYEIFADNEIAILSKCNNDNIIKLIRSEKKKYNIRSSVITVIYLPYYPQGSLLSLIRKKDHAYSKDKRKLQQKERLIIMNSLYLQMKNAITHLRNLKICHVDIRPANILVNNNHFVLCDFGNSRTFNTYKLNDGYCLGFPYIVPPFGIASDNENTITFTESYDIWSLAMVMWSIYFGIGNSDGEFMSKRNLYSYDHQASQMEYWYHLSLVLRKVSEMINNIKQLNSKSNLTNKEKYKKYILERFVIMLDPDQTCTIEKLP